MNIECCWGDVGCDCGVMLDGSILHGECHDCHCMKPDCDECGDVYDLLTPAEHPLGRRGA